MERFDTDSWVTGRACRKSHTRFLGDIQGIWSSLDRAPENKKIMLLLPPRELCFHQRLFVYLLVSSITTPLILIANNLWKGGMSATEETVRF